MRTRAAKRSEQGQTVVFAVVMLSVLIAFAAVVIDGGTLLYERRTMQGDADAAAMAAVQELPASTTLAEFSARDYTENPMRNGDDGGALGSIAFADSNTQVTVEVTKTMSGKFLTFLGAGPQNVKGRAVADISQVSAVGRMLPFGVMRDAYEISQPAEQMQLRDDNTERRGLVYPDAGEACTWTTGGSDIRELIASTEYGGALDACAMEIDEEMRTKSGWTAGAVRQGFDERLDDDTIPADSFDDVFEWDADRGVYVVKKPNSPRIGYIPVIENTDGTTEWGEKQVRITGYLMVYVGKTDAPPNYPAYTDNGKEVWMTPVSPSVLPADEDNDVTYSDTWDPDNPGPRAYRLID